MGIEIELPPNEIEAVRLDVSGLMEAVLSWHVLLGTSHHTLQLPWVRRCRSLPQDLRAELRRLGWLVGGYVPSVFGRPHAAEDFAGQVAAVRRLPDELLVRELRQALNNAPLFDFTRPASEIAYWDERIVSDVHGVLDEFLCTLTWYWDAAFADRWAETEQRVHSLTGMLDEWIRHRGVLPLLQVYRPDLDIRFDRRTVLIDRPHDHRIRATPHRPLTVLLSEFAWPHVRILCDNPWPPVLVLPVQHLARTSRTPQPARDLLLGLRAVGNESRLGILTLLAAQPRSTNELGTLLQLSAPAVSRSLKQLETAGLVRSEREGPYVLYRPSFDGLQALVDQLGMLVTSLSLRPTGMSGDDGAAS
jgi:DNA-binding transcriptional ArsR family regulator